MWMRLGDMKWRMAHSVIVVWIRLHGWALILRTLIIFIWLRIKVVFVWSTWRYKNWLQWQRWGSWIFKIRVLYAGVWLVILYLWVIIPMVILRLLSLCFCVAKDLRKLIRFFPVINGLFRQLFIHRRVTSILLRNRMPLSNAIIWQQKKWKQCFLWVETGYGCMFTFILPVTLPISCVRVKELSSNASLTRRQTGWNCRVSMLEIGIRDTMKV